MPAITKNKKTTTTEIDVTKIPTEERQANMIKYAIRATSKKFSIKGLRAEGTFTKTFEDSDPEMTYPHHKIVVTVHVRAKDPEFKFDSNSTRDEFETLLRQNIMALGKWMLKSGDRMVIKLTGFYDIPYDIPDMTRFFEGRGRMNDRYASIGRSSFASGNEVVSAGWWGVC